MKFMFMLLLCVPIYAQTAKVIQLSPEDAKQVKALYDEQAAIAKKIDALHEVIRAKYLYVGKDDPHKGNVVSMDGSYYRDGWYSFEYSEDFRFIVPTKAIPSTCFGMSCGTIQLTPAYGGSFTMGN